MCIANKFITPPHSASQNVRNNERKPNLKVVIYKIRQNTSVTYSKMTFSIHK